jgi:thioredoxin reductase (NADPH)
VFLSGHARQVHLVIRAQNLDASMSRYLIDRIVATHNVELHTRTAVVNVDGTNGQIECIQLLKEDAESRWLGAQHLFLFIGADPNTHWLDQHIVLDKKGFVVTGAAPRMPLETSNPGVFAVGDVRSGSIKRVAAGVGEGAAVVAQIHAYLAALHG